MDFCVLRQKFSEEDTKEITSILIQDDRNKTLVHLGIPSEHDDIDHWKDRLKYLYQQDYEQLDELLKAIPSLLQTRISGDAFSTCQNVLYAVLSLLESDLGNTLSQQYVDLYRQLESSLFHFQVEPQLRNNHYIAGFFCMQEKIWEIPIPRDKFDGFLVEVSLANLAASYQKAPQQVHDLIENHIHFQATLSLQAIGPNPDSMTIKVFVGLSKALTQLIKPENAVLGLYISLIPDICSFIVINELEDVEAQKLYLEKILNSRENEQKKLERLNKIVDDIRERQQRQRANLPDADRQKQDDDKQLMQVIGLISDHYLRLYDFDQSAHFWEKIKSKDLLLKFFLTFHRHPLRYLLLQFLLLCALTLSFVTYYLWNEPAHLPLLFNRSVTNLFGTLISSFQQIPNFVDKLQWYRVIEYFPLLLILLWYVPLLLLPIAIYREFKMKSKKWLYSQLLLPRLLGAAVVGLLPLLLNDLSWQVGIQINPISYILLASLTYVGSFVYAFIEVYNTVKFVPGRSVAYALGASWRIFLIAFSETLFIVTITSTLLLPMVSQHLAGDVFGIYNSIFGLSFGFSIFQILLWTGIALFIGSFVQLLWQERQITDPI